MAQDWLRCENASAAPSVAGACGCAVDAAASGWARLAAMSSRFGTSASPRRRTRFVARSRRRRVLVNQPVQIDQAARRLTLAVSAATDRLDAELGEPSEHQSPPFHRRANGPLHPRGDVQINPGGDARCSTVSEPVVKRTACHSTRTHLELAEQVGERGADL